MRILNITLSNFLCYYGPGNRIDFTDGLNLVLGANGNGKSKLYDAFQWVFRNGITDDRLTPGAAPNAIRPTSQLRAALVNERALAEAAVGDKITCEVCIEVAGSQNSVYQLIRRFHLVKGMKPADDSSLVVFYKDVVVFKPLPEEKGKEVLAQLLPPDIMPYLWFQGERGISSLIDTSSRESLKKVINRMSDIEKWDEFILAAKSAYESADKALKLALSGDATRKQRFTVLEEQEKITKSKLDAVETKIAEAEKNFEAASVKLDGIVGQFDSASKISSLEKDLAQCEAELKRVVSRYENLKLGLPKRLFTDFWLPLGTEEVVDEFERKYREYFTFVTTRQAEEDFKRKAEVVTQTQLPKGIPDRVHVVDMLKKEHCFVCDRPALKGTPEHEAIKKRLPEEKPKPASHPPLPDIEPELRILNRAAFSMRDKYSKADEAIAATYREQEELEEKRQHLEEEIESFRGAIDNEMLNSGLAKNGQAGNVVLTVAATKRDILEYSAQLDKLRGQQELLQADLSKVTAEFSNLSRGSSINPKLEQKRQLLADLHSLTIRTKERQYEQLIQLLEDTANKHFSSINKRGGAGYGKIKFVREGSGYVPEIHGEDSKRMDNLNTSQVSSFKLAIIMAIVTANQNRGLARNYPLISDAPMSDFDAAKVPDFLVETARTFTQSIIIAKEFLDANPSHPGQFQADAEKLGQVKKEVEEAGKKLNVYQLVVPEGNTVQSRKNLSVNIIRLAI